jgi:hypothetical protein
MAEVSYGKSGSGEPYPTVTPRTDVPDDLQHIQANPAEFGGLIAEGAQKAGAGALDISKFLSMCRQTMLRQPRWIKPTRVSPGFARCAVKTR